MEFETRPRRRATDKLGVIGMHQPKIEQHGPIVIHDMCCPVYFHRPAVFDMKSGVFLPSWEAQRDGYILLTVKNSWLRKLLLKLFSVHR
jgi:hypothetical protein